MMALRTEFAAALNQAATERGVDPEKVLSIIQDSIIAAYKKDYSGKSEDYSAEIDPETGEAKVFEDGKDVTPPGFGRIAAQTAKQVLLQRIREAEKGAILTEFEKKIGTVVNGMVQRVEGANIVIDLGKTEAIMLAAERMPGEEYRLNQRLKVFVVEIRETAKGQDVVVSRSHKGLVEGLFKLEVPEIGSGIVEVKAIAREAGQRSKVAVSSRQTGVDPVGSCVGQKGVRVQAVIAELGVEKIDVISHSDDSAKFVAAALSPAKVDRVRADVENKIAFVEVPDDQLSLAIGKDGQNVRLAAKLTGWKVDIKGAEGITAEKEAKKEMEKKKKAEEVKTKEKKTRKSTKTTIKKSENKEDTEKTKKTSKTKVKKAKEKPEAKKKDAAK